MKTLENVQTLQDLEDLGIGNVHCEISYRGGILGFSGSDVADHLNIPENYLPAKFGAYCNYLGGGIRGAIQTSGFYDKDIDKKDAEYLTELADACKRVYLNIENENALNDEEDENGSVNWDAVATNATRKANIKSAY